MNYPDHQLNNIKYFKRKQFSLNATYRILNTFNLFIYNKKSARKCNNGPKDVKMFFDNTKCYFQSLLIDAGKQYIYSISKLYHTNYC